MLLRIISLFSQYDLVSCVNYEKTKFNESLLMNQHHQNLLQIKDFIKEAQQKFHEDRSVLRLGNDEQESTRDDDFLDHGITNWWWEKTSSIDQQGFNTPQTFLKNRHLKWEEMFPPQSFYIRLHIGPKVSSPLRNPYLPPPPSKTNMRGPKTKKSFGRSFQPLKLHKCTRPLRPKTTLLPNTSVRGHSGQPFGPTTSLITTKEEYQKIWLREITSYYEPVERWFQTLAMKIGITTSFDTKQDPERPAPTSRKSKSIHSKAWKRKDHHRFSKTTQSERETPELQIQNISGAY